LNFNTKIWWEPWYQFYTIYTFSELDRTTISDRFALMRVVSETGDWSVCLGDTADVYWFALARDQWQYDSLLRDWQLTCLENIYALVDKGCFSIHLTAWQDTYRSSLLPWYITACGNFTIFATLVQLGAKMKPIAL